MPTEAVYVALARVIARQTEKDGRGPMVWRYKCRDDGFELGISAEVGRQVVYHLRTMWWDETNFAFTLHEPPPYDKGALNNFLERLKKL